MRDARVIGWALLALAGLAVAVALSIAASNLSTQPIGLSGEPLRAGDKLAPPPVTRTVTTTARAKRKKRKARPTLKGTPTQTRTAPVPTFTPTTPTVTAVEPGDDHGGNRQSGKGRGGGDDD